MPTTTSTQPFCHNTTSTSTQTTIRQTSHIENQRMCRPVTDWLYLPAVYIAQLAHAVDESIFTTFDPYT